MKNKDKHFYIVRQDKHLEEENVTYSILAKINWTTSMFCKVSNVINLFYVFF